MALPLKRILIVHTPLIIVSLAISFLAGCVDSSERKLQGQQGNTEKRSELAARLGSLDSASHYLGAADLQAFRAGRTKDEILKDIKWRGHFYMAAEHDGKAVCAIVYDLLSDDANIEAGVWIWATFVDGKFVKFVKPPPSLPADTELVNHRGVKQMKAGDTRFLIRALNAEAVSIPDLEKELKQPTTATPEHVDPGLTIAYLLLRAMGAVPEPGAPPSDKDYLRNAALRDQFNAARLGIGMTKPEVAATLKAKPLESGKVEAGEYEIYGSNESFNMNPWLHFSNILVIYGDGKAVAISSVPAGYDWRRDLEEATIDLPKLHR